MDDSDNKKVADNRIIENKKNIDNIDDMIDQNKNRIKSLNNMEDNFQALSRSIEKCVDLLNKSIKGNNIERKLGDISDNNKISLKRVLGTIDDERQEVNKELKNLFNQKDYLEKETRNLLNEKDENIEKYKDVDPVLKHDEEKKEYI